MGAATKPLVLVIGNVEKGFDWESLLKEIREKVEAVAKTESKEVEEQNFIDPSIIPMKVSKFCRLTDLSREAEILLNSYKKPEKHFMYPVEAMLRMLFFQRLSRIKFYTTLEAKVRDEEVARDLGFVEKEVGLLTPSERSINRFVKERLGNENLRRIQKSFIERLQSALTKKGIELGRRISIDSTPLPTLKNDECGEYNAYYFQKYNIGKMVKVHFATDVDTNIPLELIVTNATA